MTSMQYSLRDIVLVTIIVAISIGWLLDRSRLSHDKYVAVRKSQVLERMLVESLNQIKSVTGRQTEMSVDELGLHYESSQ
jgi:hypothetical protein